MHNFKEYIAVSAAMTINDACHEGLWGDVIHHLSDEAKAIIYADYVSKHQHTVSVMSTKMLQNAMDGVY